MEMRGLERVSVGLQNPDPRRIGLLKGERKKDKRCNNAESNGGQWL